MSFVANTLALATRVANQFRAVTTMITGSATGDLTSLNTSDKSSVIAALNEIKAAADGAAANGQTQAQVQAIVDAAISDLVGAAPDALNQLNELSAALGDDPNFAATITTALATKANAADVYTKTELGDPTTDYVAAFNTALTV